MSTFDRREEGFEKKFAHDEETKFKIIARRNRLMGLWVAEQLGKSGADADAYAQEVVQADFKEPGHADVVRKVRADLKAKHIDISEHRLEKRLEEFHEAAKQQITG